MITKQAVGRKLKAIRERKGLTLEYVGVMVGKRKQTIAKYESGTISISLDIFVRLIILYDYPIERFFKDL